MEERRASYGPDLPVAEKAANGHVFQVLVENAGVEVRLSVEALSPAEAREQQGAGHLTRSRPSVAGQDRVQVFGGGVRVAEVEADARAFRKPLSNGYRPAAGGRCL